MFGFFKSSEAKKQSAQLYRLATVQARQPVFYTDLSVPDTVDGRFDLICLHVFLIIDRLYDEGKEGKKLGQAVFDRMFREMDMSLREQGVGDLGVPKHMKRMMTGFNGRALAYKAALRQESELPETLLRNLYGSAKTDIPQAAVEAMAAYLKANKAHLAAIPFADFRQSEFEFMPVSKQAGGKDERNDTARMVA